MTTCNHASSNSRQSGMEALLFMLMLKDVKDKEHKINLIATDCKPQKTEVPFEIA